MIKENGVIVKCPKCDSSKVVHVHPFDYVKQCENSKCPYHVKNDKGWKYQFSTGIHN